MTVWNRKVTSPSALRSDLTKTEAIAVLSKFSYKTPHPKQNKNKKRKKQKGKKTPSWGPLCKLCAVPFYFKISWQMTKTNI